MSIIFNLCSSILYWCESWTMDWHVNKSKEYFCHQQVKGYYYSFTGFTELLSVSYFGLAVKFLWFPSIPLSSCHEKMYTYPHFAFCEPLWTQRIWDGVISIMTRLWTGLLMFESWHRQDICLFSKNVQARSGAHRGFYSVCTAVLYQIWSSCGMELTSHGHLVPRLRRVES